jgi:hypothetical protein
MRNCGQVAVYAHSFWSGSLLHGMLPGAHCITVRLGEASQDVLARLPEACRVFVFHVNLTLSTRVPLDRDKLVGELAARDVVVRNATVCDISKSAVQQACARAGVASLTAAPDGDPDELVLVKTSYNYHGVRERELTAQQRSMLGYESPDDLPSRQEADYRVMPRRDVPGALWTSPHWVVERYVANAAHRFHRVYLAGDAMVVSRVFDSSTFKKMPIGVPRENYYLNLSDTGCSPAVPSEISSAASVSARIARAAHLEYGAFDVVSDDDGEMYVIDINTTPSWHDGGHPNMLEYLGAGLTGHRDGG